MHLTSIAFQPLPLSSFASFSKTFTFNISISKHKHLFSIAYVIVNLNSYYITLLRFSIFLIIKSLSVTSMHVVFVSHHNFLTIISLTLVISLFLLNPDLRIFTVLGWVSFFKSFQLMDLSHIFLGDWSTCCLFNPLVSGTTILSFNVTQLIVVLLVEGNCIIKLCI